MYFTKTPTIIVYGILMVICAYGAKRGLEQIGSVAWLSFPYIQFSFFVALLLTMGQGNANFLFPIFGPGAWEIVKESSLKLSIFGDFVFLFFIIPYVKNTNVFKKGTWIALFVIVANMVIGMISYVFLFDYTTVMQLNYPFHEVIRTISVGFLANLETFFFPFWIIESIVRFAAYLFLTALLFGHLFHIKHFEYIIPSLATIVVFIGILPETPSDTIFVLREGLLWGASPILFLLPFLIWVIAKVKGVLKNE
ncbi:hypothetical protein GCM10008025_32950 [Ornithinibacillus halotolerans]|uniref:Spore germination protein n=2 Tax=Ornithinibacillus halotolerans TaxID=1274357 RepID=A0A916S782_9BACI|nr:hypothetical protein GCM10008025_32950 [Ornithinibacillus halotolerans]